MVQVPLPIASNKVISIVIEQFDNDGQQTNQQPLHNEIVTYEPIVEEPQGVTLRRSQRKRRLAIPNDYMIYIQESDFDVRTSKNPVLFSQAMKSNNFDN